ncbi:hypothetical protein QUV96_05235 [Amedibacillus dolichus]|uniref:Zinc ribbon domain-containing protein n=1 Tax=Amedibacillus dolichus TaxID=31971 RepID=A0ABT7UBQ2_9FIRM|nr:hypothetical protein [Amedibacillus dolichus]MDM8157039.1 hypothetical protein [Amedibacillus dolichus]
MYIEFVVIFICLGIIILLQAALLICLLKRTANRTVLPQNVSSIEGRSTSTVVFCKNCATQYDASLRSCPKCGTPR